MSAVGIFYAWCGRAFTMNLRFACSGLGMKPGRARIALAVL